MAPSYNHFFRSYLIRCETLNTIVIDGEFNHLHLDTMGDCDFKGFDIYSAAVHVVFDCDSLQYEELRHDHNLKPCS